jgi:hypothetical protein
VLLPKLLLLLRLCQHSSLTAATPYAPLRLLCCLLRPRQRLCLQELLLRQPLQLSQGLNSSRVCWENQGVFLLLLLCHCRHCRCLQ